MALGGILFSFWRILEIITLIPTLGMMAYFVNAFVTANQLTPNWALVLFITSVLAAVWAIVTLFRHKSTRRSAFFVALVDLAFVGAFIASVYELRFISNASCSSFSSGTYDATVGQFSFSGPTLSLHTNKTCAMLKASFAFGIMNTIFFFVTFVHLLFMHRGEREVTTKETYVRERRRSHDSRRGHSRSGSGHHRSSRDSRRGGYV